MTRVVRASELHDCAMLTAFRTYDNDGNPVGKKRNIYCNNKLGQALRCLDYGITSVVGTYAEQVNDMRKMSENSWFVVNLHDSKEFISNIIKLGEDAKQDSVFILPRGSFVTPSLAYLVGTNLDNDFDEAWIRYQEKKFASEVNFDDDNDLLTRVKNRYFYFKFEDKDKLFEQERVFMNFSDAQISFEYFKKNFPHVDFGSLKPFSKTSKMSRCHME